jgi:hypothetical protein
MSLSRKILATLAAHFRDDAELVNGIHARNLGAELGIFDSLEIWVSDRRCHLTGMEICALLKAEALGEEVARKLRKPDPWDEAQRNPLIGEAKTLMNLLDAACGNNPRIGAIWTVGLLAVFPALDEAAILTPGECGVIVRSITSFLAMVFAANPSLVEAMIDAAAKRIQKRRAP